MADPANGFEAPTPRKSPRVARTSHGLRDILFDEIEDLRGGDGDPIKSMAVANLAKQIINVAKVEIEAHRQMVAQAEQGNPMVLGSLELGTPAASAATPASTAP